MRFVFMVMRLAMRVLQFEGIVFPDKKHTRTEVSTGMWFGRISDVTSEGLFPWCSRGDALRLHPEPNSRLIARLNLIEQLIRIGGVRHRKGTAIPDDRLVNVPARRQYQVAVGQRIVALPGKRIP